eukprot:1167012-Amphidinium_carterae.2
MFCCGERTLTRRLGSSHNCGNAHAPGAALSGAGGTSNKLAAANSAFSCDAALGARVVSEPPPLKDDYPIHPPCSFPNLSRKMEGEKTTTCPGLIRGAVFVVVSVETSRTSRRRLPGALTNYVHNEKSINQRMRVHLTLPSARKVDKAMCFEYR